MAESGMTATERAEPVAWIEHHKGGDNLVWEPQKNGLRYSPLYLSTSPSQAQLDVAEFNDYMTKVEAWAAERGVWLADLEAA